MILHPAWRINRACTEGEKISRIEVAEKELRSLQKRSREATDALLARKRQNHWRESIEAVIRGEL